MRRPKAPRPASTFPAPATVVVGNDIIESYPTMQSIPPPPPSPSPRPTEKPEPPRRCLHCFSSVSSPVSSPDSPRHASDPQPLLLCTLCPCAYHPSCYASHSREPPADPFVCVRCALERDAAAAVRAARARRLAAALADHAVRARLPLKLQVKFSPAAPPPPPPPPADPRAPRTASGNPVPPKLRAKAARAAVVDAGTRAREMRDAVEATEKSEALFGKARRGGGEPARTAEEVAEGRSGSTVRGGAEERLGRDEDVRPGKEVRVEKDVHVRLGVGVAGKDDLGKCAVDESAGEETGSANQSRVGVLEKESQRETVEGKGDVEMVKPRKDGAGPSDCESAKEVSVGREVDCVGEPGRKSPERKARRIGDGGDEIKPDVRTGLGADAALGSSTGAQPAMSKEAGQKDVERRKEEQLRASARAWATEFKAKRAERVAAKKAALQKKAKDVAPRAALSASKAAAVVGSPPSVGTVGTVEKTVSERLRASSPAAARDSQSNESPPSKESRTPSTAPSSTRDRIPSGAPSLVASEVDARKVATIRESSPVEATVVPDARRCGSPKRSRTKSIVVNVKSPSDVGSDAQADAKVMPAKRLQVADDGNSSDEVEFCGVVSGPRKRRAVEEIPHPQVSKHPRTESRGAYQRSSESWLVRPVDRPQAALPSYSAPEPAMAVIPPIMAPPPPIQHHMRASLGEVPERRATLAVPAGGHLHVWPHPVVPGDARPLPSAGRDSAKRYLRRQPMSSREPQHMGTSGHSQVIAQPVIREPIMRDPVRSADLDPGHRREPFRPAYESGTKVPHIPSMSKRRVDCARQDLTPRTESGGECYDRAYREAPGVQLGYHSRGQTAGMETGVGHPIRKGENVAVVSGERYPSQYQYRGDTFPQGTYRSERLPPLQSSHEWYEMEAVRSEVRDPSVLAPPSHSQESYYRGVAQSPRTTARVQYSGRDPEEFLNESVDIHGRRRVRRVAPDHARPAPLPSVANMLTMPRRV